MKKEDRIGEGDEEKGDRDESFTFEEEDRGREASYQDEDLNNSGGGGAKERLYALTLRGATPEIKDSGIMQHLGRVYV